MICYNRQDNWRHKSNSYFPVTSFTVIPDRSKPKYAMDIGFVLDNSGSVRSDYGRMKDFVNLMANAVFSQSTRASVILMGNSKTTQLAVNFKESTNVQDFQRRVLNLPYINSGPRLDKALSIASWQMYTRRRGARYRSRKVLFIITDGLHTMSSEGGEISLSSYAYDLKRRGVVLCPIGVSKAVDQYQLRNIAFSPDYMYHVENFSLLQSIYFVKDVYKRCVLRQGRSNSLF